MVGSLKRNDLVSAYSVRISVGFIGGVGFVLFPAKQSLIMWVDRTEMKVSLLYLDI